MNQDSTELRMQQMRDLRDAIHRQRPNTSGKTSLPVARPVLFNDAMLLALLDGRKTQTRRLFRTAVVASRQEQGRNVCLDENGHVIPCHLGTAGDQLWVRERWVVDRDASPPRYSYGVDNQPNDRPKRIAWKPSLHMPRTAARLILDITSVRTEQLQSISNCDARAEGFDPSQNEPNPLIWFRKLWDGIFHNLGTRWDDDPWVWVISFRVSIQPAEPRP